MFVGETSSPISLADCRIISRPISTQSGDISNFITMHFFPMATNKNLISDVSSGD
uniref:Uncharacterized protein n=1 Tax=Arundo donax TaxID=35708 RepID=A0A0A9B2B5_ARUDO